MFDHLAGLALKELTRKMRIDSDKTAVEYPNFDHEVCTSVPVIKSNEVDLRHASVEVYIEEYTAIGKVDDASDGDNNGNDNENLEVELLASLRGTVKLLDRLIHKDDMTKDDTDSLLAIREKAETLTIQREKNFHQRRF